VLLACVSSPAVLLDAHVTWHSWGIQLSVNPMKALKSASLKHQGPQGNVKKTLP